MRVTGRGRNRRAGYTLIEMAAVVASTTAVLAVSALTLKLGVDAEERSRGRANDVRTLAAVAEAFHADVNAAEELAVERERPQVWRFALDENHAVEYTVSKGRLVRRETRGTKTVSTQEFILPPDAVVNVAEESHEGKPFVRLMLSFPNSTRDGIAVVASLGHDRRFIERKEKP